MGSDSLGEARESGRRHAHKSLSPVFLLSIFPGSKRCEEGVKIGKITLFTFNDFKIETLINGCSDLEE
jgi:hypothetical protein